MTDDYTNQTLCSVCGLPLITHNPRIQYCRKCSNEVTASLTSLGGGGRASGVPQDANQIPPPEYFKDDEFDGEYLTDEDVSGKTIEQLKGWKDGKKD